MDLINLKDFARTPLFVELVIKLHRKCSWSESYYTVLEYPIVLKAADCEVALFNEATIFADGSLRDSVADDGHFIHPERFIFAATLTGASAMCRGAQEVAQWLAQQVVAITGLNISVEDWNGDRKDLSEVEVESLSFYGGDLQRHPAPQTVLAAYNEKPELGEQWYIAIFPGDAENEYEKFLSDEAAILGFTNDSSKLPLEIHLCNNDECLSPKRQIW